MKADVYEKITSRIVSELEQGVRPWHQPWNAGHSAGPVSRPLRANGEVYRGINIVMLWATAMEKGFAAPIWMTFKQAKERGAHVRKGEKGATVVYAGAITRAEENDKGETEAREIPFMKGYSVFNVEQIEGLPPQFTATVPQINEDERIVDADAFFKNLRASISHGGNRACYSVAQDIVQIPPFEAFRSAIAYYATLTHECTHWTRHPSRLGRDLGRKRWGDQGYAMEELVAELGAAFLCADLRLTPEIRDEHASYIAGWLEVLKNDKRAIFTAASNAQKAADFLHSLQPQQMEAAA